MKVESEAVLAFTNYQMPTADKRCCCPLQSRTLQP